MSCAEALNLQGKGVEIARKEKFKERPQNLHLSEFAKNGICKERNLQEWNLQEMDFAKNVYAYSLLDGLCCVYHSSVGGSIWPAIPVYIM